MPTFIFGGTKSSPVLANPEFSLSKFTGTPCNPTCREMRFELVCPGVCS